MKQLYRLTPADGSVVTLHTREQRLYMENPDNPAVNGIDYLNPVRSTLERSRPRPVTLAFTPAYDGVVRLSRKPDLADAVELPAVNGRAEAVNLYLDADYYWQAVTAHGATDIGHFRTETTPPRMLAVEGVSNVRDFGGFRTKTGRRVRQGLILRSAALNQEGITAAGRQTLCGFGVKTDLDVRIPGEFTFPMLDESRVRYRNIPLLAYSFIRDTTQWASYRETYDFIRDPAVYPLFIHCWGGIDRTGCWLFMLGAMLGVPEEDLLLDYEMSSFSINGPRSRRSDYFIRFREDLAAFGDDLQEAAVGFLRHCGVTDETMDRIRAILLED